MPNTPDIIGVVEELKAFKSECSSCNTRNDVRKLTMFDPVAAALLIAVKELERITNRTAMGGNEEMTIHAVEGIALSALDQIRSLPV